MTPVREGLVVSPADGRVSLVVNAVPPPELGLGERPLPRISIFMSVFDCHVNRSPVTGRIERIVYAPASSSTPISTRRARTTSATRWSSRPARARIGVVQIAGLVARRIVPSCARGRRVAAGERIGMIRFGSRVDVYLPEGVRPLVAEGQTAIAGETVIADLAAADAGRSYPGRLKQLTRRLAGGHARCRRGDRAAILPP